MATINPEDLISSELAKGLRQLRRGLWDEVLSNPLKYLRSGRRPDIVAKVGAYQHVVIENEIGKNPEKDAASRLKEFWWKGGPPVVAVVALRTPVRFREIPPDDIPGELAQARDLECFVLSDDKSRWPKSGYVPLSVRGIADLVDHVSRPLSAIDDAADILTQAIENAGTVFHSLRHPAIAQALHQEAGSQTWRMAASMVANALIFQDSLTGFTPDKTNIRAIKSIAETARDGVYNHQDFLAEWNHILGINYWPIFDIAVKIIEPLDAKSAADILQTLARAALKIRAMGASGASDFTGLVFQRLIVDRKFLATFYTLPASAELLAGLAIGEKWFSLKQNKSGKTVPDFSIADFACGTGGLLVAAARRIGNIVAEKHGVDRDELHKMMMEKAVFGADVFPSAVHLTASLLSSARPRATYLESLLYELPYGKSPEWTGPNSKTGSIELIAHEQSISLSAKRLVGKKTEKDRKNAAYANAPNNSFQLVIMNPPFTRATNHASKRSAIPNPAFAGLGNNPEEQKEMADLTTQILAGKKYKTDGIGAYHGNAGLATAFLDLADLKIADGGILAFVLPMTFATGSAWENARNLIRQRYTDIRIVTIAAPKSRLQSFSADTDLAECLLIARRGTPQGKNRYATSIVLTRRPQTPMEGTVFAGLIKESLLDGKVLPLEDSPVGAGTVRFGEEIIAHITEAKLPESGFWGFAGVRDFETVQTAYQLAKRGRLWFPGGTQKDSHGVAIAPIGEFAQPGPIHRDINGINPDKTMRGPYTIIPILPNKVPTVPCLWNHDHTKETCLEVKPDTEAVLRNIDLVSKAQKIRATVSRVHWNLDFGFGSQSTNVVMTAVKSLGGRAWPSITLQNEIYEKAFTVWHNSTLGLLLRWWNSNRQQAGRGIMTVTTIPAMPSLDVRQLSKAQLKTADKIYDEMKNQPMLSFHRLHKDKTRHELDRRVLVDMLGLPHGICAENGPLQLLREKLAAEPSIHGGRDA